MADTNDNEAVHLLQQLDPTRGTRYSPAARDRSPSNGVGSSGSTNNNTQPQTSSGTTLPPIHYDNLPPLPQPDLSGSGASNGLHPFQPTGSSSFQSLSPHLNSGPGPALGGSSSSSFTPDPSTSDNKSSIEVPGLQQSKRDTTGGHGEFIDDDMLDEDEYEEEEDDEMSTTDPTYGGGSRGDVRVGGGGGASGDATAAAAASSSSTPAGGSAAGAEGEGGEEARKGKQGKQRGRKPKSAFGAGLAKDSSEYQKLRKENHKNVEKKRRETINDGIKRLANLVPGSDKNKSRIINQAADYIETLLKDDSSNIEKWTLEKMIADRQIKEQYAQINELKNQNIAKDLQIEELKAFVRDLSNNLVNSRNASTNGHANASNGSRPNASGSGSGSGSGSSSGSGSTNDGSNIPVYGNGSS